MQHSTELCLDKWCRCIISDIRWDIRCSSSAASSLSLSAWLRTGQDTGVVTENDHTAGHSVGSHSECSGQTGLQVNIRRSTCDLTRDLSLRIRREAPLLCQQRYFGKNWINDHFCLSRDWSSNSIISQEFIFAAIKVWGILDYQGVIFRYSKLKYGCNQQRMFGILKV